MRSGGRSLRSRRDADCHAGAKLLRVWLRNPDDPSDQVVHFRSLFGEVTWRALLRANPKLVREVEDELARRKNPRR